MDDDRAKTGIKRFDEIIDGGIPRGNTVLVSGGPGTGKTLFGWQFLYYGAKDHGESGIFITMEERPRDLRKNLSEFGWNIRKLEDEGLIAIIDAASPKIGLPSKERYVEEKPFDIDSLMYKVHTVANEIDAKRLVVDSIPALGFRLDETQIRDSIYKLNALLLEIGCTSILTSEKMDPGISSNFKIAEYIAHGLVNLELVRRVNEFKRSGVVVKMRGTNHSMKIFPFEITDKGIGLLAGELY